MVDWMRQAGDKVSFQGRGVPVPKGVEAWQIMAGARALEKRHDVAPYISRMMVCDVLAAIAEATPEPSSKINEPDDMSLT